MQLRFGGQSPDLVDTNICGYIYDNRIPFSTEVQVERDVTAAEGTAAERGRAQITMTTTTEVGGAIGGGALCTKMNRMVVGVVVGGGVPYTKVMQMAVDVVVGDGVL